MGDIKKSTKSVIISIGNVYVYTHIHIHTQGKEEGWREGRRGRVGGERDTPTNIYVGLNRYL